MPVDLNEDRMISAMRVLEAADRLNAQANRDRQFDLQAKGVLLEAERNELSKVAAQRQQDMDRLQIWNKGRAETAASYAAAGIPQIDLDHPDGEKKLGDWLSYAQANGVSEDSIRDIFGPRMRELEVKKEYKTRAQAEALGARGLALYDSFKNLKGNDGNNSFTPDRAFQMAQESEEARASLSNWQKFAESKGFGFVLTPEDWSKIKKRIGTDPYATAQTGGGLSGQNNTGAPATTPTQFDPRPVYYDPDEVNAVISKYVSPELKRLADQESAKSGRDAREQEAAITLKTAQAKEATANASKATFEASVFNNTLNNNTPVRTTKGDAGKSFFPSPSPSPSPSPNP